MGATNKEIARDIPISKQKRFWTRLFWVSALACLLIALVSRQAIVDLVILGAMEPHRSGFRVERHLPGKAPVSFRTSTSKFRLEQPNSWLRAYCAWKAPRCGAYIVQIDCDDMGWLKIDGKPAITLTGINAHAKGSIRWVMEAGPHLLDIKLINKQARGWLELKVQGPGDKGLHLLSSRDIRYIDLGNYYLWAMMIPWLYWGGLIGFAVLLILIGGLFSLEEC